MKKHFYSSIIISGILLIELVILALFLDPSTINYLYVVLLLIIANALAFWVSRYFSIQKSIAKQRLQIPTPSDRLTTSLEITKKLQKYLLPEKNFTLPQLDIYVRSRPSDEIGGDFYQMLNLNNGQALIAMGDAAGHGLPSAMVSVMVDTLLHAYIDEKDLTQMLNRMNAILHQRIDPTLFSTLLLLQWDSDRHVMNIASAGFGRFLHYDSIRKQLNTFKIGGVALGMVPSAQLKVGRDVCKLQTNDVLVLCTDGVIDMTNAMGQRLGMDRWQKIVADHIHAGTAEQIFEAISQDLLSFAGTARQIDDITLMIIRSVC